MVTISGFIPSLTIVNLERQQPWLFPKQSFLFLHATNYTKLPFFALFCNPLNNRMSMLTNVQIVLHAKVILIDSWWRTNLPFILSEWSSLQCISGYLFLVFFLRGVNQILTLRHIGFSRISLIYVNTEQSSNVFLFHHHHCMIDW